MRSFGRGYDFSILAIVLILVCTGVGLIFSATWGAENPDLGQTVKQVIAAGIGFAVMGIASFLDYRRYRDAAVWLYLLAVGLCVSVIFFGANIRGARSWFALGGFNFQPSEFAKIALIFILARYFSKRHGATLKWTEIVFSAALALFMAGIIVLQNDLGSALLLVAIWLGMVLVAGMRWQYFSILSIGGVGVSLWAWFYMLKQYQKDRILVFLHPEKDTQKIGYNVEQAKVAIGSGGWFGKGLGQGSQSQLKFLPEQQTDFIFSVLGEELGFVGIAVLVGLFAFLIFSLLIWSLRMRDLFGRYVLLGIATMLMSQFFLNVAGNIGLMPVTGVTLPLLSYGGSSLIMVLFALGVAQSVIRRVQTSIWAERSSDFGAEAQ